MCELRDGLLCRSASTLGSKHSSPARVVIPLSFQRDYMRSYHDLSGHQGVKRTLALLQARVWWPSMTQRVKRYVKDCGPCSRSKPPNTRAGAAELVGNGEHPWDVVTIDLYYVGACIDGYDHVLVMADQFTRRVHAIPVQGTPSSEQVLSHFFREIIRVHGCPRAIRCDHGSILISEVCRAFYETYRVVLQAGTAEHHTTPGLCERFNRTLSALLMTHRCATADPRWYLYVGHLELAYNAVEQAAHGFSPFFLDCGRDACLPQDLTLPSITPLSPAPPTYLANQLEWMHASWDVVRHRLHLNALARQAKISEKGASELIFCRGDRVLVRNPPGTKKWIEPTQGPYRIGEALENGNYRLRDLRSQHMHDTIHASRLIPFPFISNDGDEAVGDSEDIVERIVDRRRIANTSPPEYSYKLRLRGHAATSDLWYELPSLVSCLDLVQAYDLSHPFAIPPPISPLDPVHDPPSRPSLPPPAERRNRFPTPDRIAAILDHGEAPGTSPPIRTFKVLLTDSDRTVWLEEGDLQSYAALLVPYLASHSLAPLDTDPASESTAASPSTDTLPDPDESDWQPLTMELPTQSLDETAGDTQSLDEIATDTQSPDETAANDTALLRQAYGTPFSHPNGPNGERRREGRQEFLLMRPRPTGYSRFIWIWPGINRELLRDDEERRILAWRLDHLPA